MVIVDLDYLEASTETVQGGISSGVSGTASGGAFGNFFSTVSVFTGAYSFSGRIRY